MPLISNASKMPGVATTFRPPASPPRREGIPVAVVLQAHRQVHEAAKAHARGRAAARRAASRRGKRATSAPIAMRASSRATFMPAQACAPWPNATCRLGLRAMSSASGSANCAGSRFAAPTPSVTKSPAGSSRVAERDRRGEQAVVQLQRALEAQQFLDRAVDQRRLALQALELAALREQRVHAVADQVGGGLVAGVEQEDAVVQQLGLAEALAVVLALDQPRQHVGLGVAGVARGAAATSPRR